MLHLSAIQNLFKDTFMNTQLPPHAWAMAGVYVLCIWGITRMRIGGVVTTDSCRSCQSNGSLTCTSTKHHRHAVDDSRKVHRASLDAAMMPTTGHCYCFD